MRSMKMLKYGTKILSKNCTAIKFRNSIPSIFCNHAMYSDTTCLINRHAHSDVPKPNFDGHRNTKLEDAHSSNSASADERRGRVALGTLTMGTMALYGAKTVIVQAISSMAPAADVLAMAKLEIKLNDITEGKTKVFKWRGKPIFVTHRLQEIIEQERRTKLMELRDPETDDERVKRPEWLIVIGICTHLGCIPLPNSGDFKGGYYCPCHGSHYDGSGRIRKGPAPTNLSVPSYEFISDDNVIIG